MITAAQLADGQDALPLGQGRSVWRQRSAIAAVVILYLGFGVLSNLPSWTGGVTHTMQCGGCGDSGQEVWFLAWGAHALTHLLDPIRSNFLNYPWGVDLADNTSMPLAGAIATPITLLFGPITTFNVVFSLAFAGSATAMFFVLRRFTTWMVAAFIGGLLYGFCPYMVGQGEGHIFLMLAAVPPVMLLLLDEIIVRQRARWWIMGLLLGLVDDHPARMVGGIACLPPARRCHRDSCSRHRAAAPHRQPLCLRGQGDRPRRRGAGSVRALVRSCEPDRTRAHHRACALGGSPGRAL